MIPTQARQRLAAVIAVTIMILVATWIVDDGGDGRDEPSAPRTVQAELAAEAWTLDAHAGVGAWIDVYDWTEEFSRGGPRVGVDDIDRMAVLGIETVYVQTAHNRSVEPGVIEQAGLERLIERAHEHGMHVVAWYLPPLVDVAADLRRLVASANLPVDGLGVDIEALEVTDPAERNRRLLDLTTQLRAEVGEDKVLAAITPSPVHLQVVNPAFWPAFPWAEVAEHYDVILPMSYWSIRDEALRDGERYVGDDIDRVRASTGDAEIPIHVIGGIADALPPDQVAGMARAALARGVLGGSLYDWATSNDAQWAAMAPLHTSASP